MKKLPTKHISIKAKVSDTATNALYERIAVVIRDAGATVTRSVDSTMVKAYWHIGRYLVEEEQKGARRAKYGKELLKTISVKLKQEFGGGFVVSTLEDIRKFYITYSTSLDHPKSHALRGELSMPDFNHRSILDTL